MKKLLTLSAAAALFVSIAGCATVEQGLQGANSLLLSNREVREVFQGNTVRATTGETFYWDTNGSVIGKGSYGGVIKGNWNITDDGRLCISNWSSSTAPGGCYKVYFDNTTRQFKLVDLNGELKWTVMNFVEGNPNNF
jgi:hypothetical protein